MADAPKKYAEQMVDWLVELGYTHCFFVAGGNIMHLLDAVTDAADVHSGGARGGGGNGGGVLQRVGAEGRKALALVTAGPGLTNIVSAVAAAWLESRELLVIGGQVKSTDLATDGVRQRGIQEVDGVSVVAPLTVTSMRIERPVAYDVFAEAVIAGRRAAPGAGVHRGVPGRSGRSRRAGRGARSSNGRESSRRRRPTSLPRCSMSFARRSGRCSCSAAASRAPPRRRSCPTSRRPGIPVMTTWNGADRVPADHPLTWGRPNTWGQRGANLLLQQADLAVALGSRLGLQQTGFAWEHFVPNGRVVQVDIDPAELHKGHPRSI